MDNPISVPSKDHIAAAAEATAVATAAAAQAASDVVTAATKLAATTQQEGDLRAAKISSDAIRAFFNEGQKHKRFLDTERIPFICDDIKEIKKDMKTLTRFVYVGVGLFMALSIIVPIIVKLAFK